MPPNSERPQSPNAQSSAYATRSLFPQAPTFTLETFSKREFNVKDFVESLADTAVPPNRRSGQSNQVQAFDPRPLIRTLENGLTRLSELSGDLEARETELSAAVRRAETQHASNVDSLGKKLDHAIEDFRKLDRSLDEQSNDFGAGGNTAVKIGARLEELDRQRLRAQDAKFLIQCWLEVSEKGELFLLDDMRRQASGERKIRAAQIARQLLKISQRLDPGSWGESKGFKAKGVNGTNGINGHDATLDIRHNTREIVEKFRESLEKDLLKQFDEFYRRADFDGMRGCADVLEDFSGGASVIAAFVNQHQFFIDRRQLITEEVGGDAEAWDLLADPDADAPGIEPSLQSLVDEVKVVAQDESQIIKKAFSYYDVVLGRFLQRVFQQSIQQRLEMVLDKASRISNLAFLRSLQASRSYISALIDDLKTHGLTEHPEPLSTQTALVLDQQLDDLFVPYFVGSSYIEREKRTLEELYSSLLFKFTVYHSQRRKAPTTFLASLAKSGSEILSSAREAYVERLDSADLAPQQKRMLMRVAGLKDNDSARRQMETEVKAQDGVLDIATARRMLKWLAEGVGRGLELSGGSETPKDVSALLDLLLTHMGSLYVEVSLDAASEAAASQDNSRNEPDLSYLENLNGAITILHLMATFINTVLIPLAASNTLVRREMERHTSNAMGQMEDKVNSIMQRTVDVVLSWVSKLLSNQKKPDYKPKDDTIGGTGTLLELNTPVILLLYTTESKAH